MFFSRSNNEKKVVEAAAAAAAAAVQKSNANAKYKLIYSEDRGKADIIKLLFAYVKQPYEDVQIKSSDWLAYKAFMPFEQLPVLIVNDGELKLAQVSTICRFLAKRFQLDGANETENIVCDMVSEQLKECADQMSSALQNADSAQKKSAQMSRLLNETLPRTLAGYEKMLNMNNSRFVVGQQLTWADLAIVNAWDWMGDEVRMTHFVKYPLVKKHYEFIRSIAEVEHWFKHQKPLMVIRKV